VTCKRLRARKSLYNAGTVLQELFYVYREKLFDKLIAKVEVKGRKLYVQEGLYPKPISSYDCVQTFPKGLFSNESDKRAVLVHLACSDAVCWMQEVVEDVLAGKILLINTLYVVGKLIMRIDVVSHITEIAVKPKNNKREVIAVAINGQEHTQESPHSIWKVVLKSTGESYILDFSGAQFGYYEPVTPMIEYFQHRVLRVISKGAENLGSTRKCILGFSEDKSIIGLLIRVHKDGHTCLRDGVLNWEEVSEMNVNDLLHLPPAKFKEELKNLLMCLVEACDEFLLWLKQRHDKVKADIDAGKKRPGVYD